MKSMLIEILKKTLKAFFFNKLRTITPDTNSDDFKKYLFSFVYTIMDLIRKSPYLSKIHPLCTATIAHHISRNENEIPFVLEVFGLM